MDLYYYTEIGKMEKRENRGKEGKREVGYCFGVLLYI